MRSIGAEVLDTAPEDRTLGAIVYDATGIDSSERLKALYEFFHPIIRSLKTNGRVVVLGTAPEDCASAREATAQRALEGFTRSLGKEVRYGSAVQLVYVKPGAEGNTESTLRFLLGAKSAYVSGQVVRIGEGEPGPPRGLGPPAGRQGRAGDRRLARDRRVDRHHHRPRRRPRGLPRRAAGRRDAHEGGQPHRRARRSRPTSPTRRRRRAIAKHLLERHGGVDVVIHNAGVTRDKTLGKMDDRQWGMVLDINLSSQERINDALIEQKVLRPNGTIVSVSSQSGIAGNAGQTNYGTSKAGVIGMVQALGAAARGHPGHRQRRRPGLHRDRDDGRHARLHA